MNKIPIKEISKEVYTQKGFGTGPFSSCLTCKCGTKREGGACCRWGVYVDKEAYDHILKHRKILEKRVGLKLEECFDKRWSKDNEFLGHGSIGTRVVNKTCAFRVNPAHGCEIARLVFEKKRPKRMIPSGCRIYPISWDKGKMFIRDIKKNCACVDQNNITKKSIFETQKKEIEDIFSFK